MEQRPRTTGTAVRTMSRPAEDRATGVSVDLTTELRWFFDGCLPTDVHAWFTRDGAGLIEHRRDKYRVDDRVDTGVKRRSQETLELKVRVRPPQTFVIADHVYGCMESWQRSSPADGLLVLDERTIWVDIDKTIVKRRFSTDGQEQPLSAETRAMTGNGCDAEIAALQLDGRDAWTFAFAAFGAPDTHQDALIASWRSLVAEHERPDQLRLHTARSSGYPEWMSKARQFAV